MNEGIYFSYHMSAHTKRMTIKGICRTG